MKGHWQRTCRTPKFLVDLYQASIKEKGKIIEMNFAHHSDPKDHMGYSDIQIKWTLPIWMSLISLRMLMEELII